MKHNVLNKIKADVDTMRGTELWPTEEKKQITLILDSAVLLGTAVENDLNSGDRISAKTKALVSTLTAQCALFLGA